MPETNGDGEKRCTRVPFGGLKSPPPAAEPSEAARSIRRRRPCFLGKAENETEGQSQNPRWESTGGEVEEGHRTNDRRGSRKQDIEIRYDADGSVLPTRHPPPQEVIHDAGLKRTLKSATVGRGGAR